MIKRKFQTFFACLVCLLLTTGMPGVIFGQQTNDSSVTVTGTVSDEKNEALIGVSVIVKGTQNGTVTDLDGNYSISCRRGDVISFSYMGYLTEDVKFTNQTRVNVTLKEDNKLLDEVVVIGYGTAIRKDVVGAVDQVQKKVLENRPVANLTQALQGASANLVIQQRSANPNDNKMNLNIRGISTMNNNGPLIVIDGLIAESGSMNKLNPNEIENVSVLKDAGSAAIYGSRSGNGVILITTKQGKKNERTTVRFNGSLGWQDPNILFSPVKGYENAVLKNITLGNSGKALEFTPEKIQELAAHGDAPWGPDQMFKSGLQQTYNLSVTGGSASTTYAASAGYFNQRSNLIGPHKSLDVGDYGIQRYNVRLNVSTEYKRFKLTQILSYTREENLGDQANGEFTYVDAYRVPRYYYYAFKAPDGRYTRNNVLGAGNPIGELERRGYQKWDNDFINTNTSVEFKIMDGLKIRGIFGADIINDHRFIRRFDVPYYNYDDPADAEPTYSTSNWPVEDYYQKVWLTNMQGLLDYDKKFGVHSIKGLLGVSQESYTRKATDLKMQYTDPLLGIPISGQTEYKDSGSIINNTTKRSIVSVFGRVDYSYADKYYAGVSLRYDGSSKFPKDNRWGVFPSFSAAWRLSEEGFMNTYKSNIGDLKLRATYGILGNQEIGEYQYITTYDIHANQYSFGNKEVSGTGFNYGNTDITWEKMKTFNIGADLTFLNNSLNVSLDYFHKKTTDILIKPVVPTVFGTELKDYNLGEMQNQGWEVTVNYRLAAGKFNHMFGFNLADSWNKVKRFEGFQQIEPMDSQMYRIIREGLPFNSYYAYKTDGLFQSQEEINNSAVPTGLTGIVPGDVKYVDRNGDGVIDEKDRFVIGNAFPRYTFGITYSTEFKGFDLSILAQGVAKRKMTLRGELMEPFHGSYSFSIFKHQLDTWTPVNTGAKYPRLSIAGTDSNTNNFGQPSDYYVLNAAYFRLKDIQIGYTVPRKLTSRFGIGKIRGYVNAQNLFTLTKNSFIDPENTEFGGNMNSDGNNSGRNYPTIKYYGFGIEVEF